MFQDASKTYFITKFIHWIDSTSWESHGGIHYNIYVHSVHVNVYYIYRQTQTTALIGKCLLSGKDVFNNENTIKVGHF